MAMDKDGNVVKELTTTEKLKGLLFALACLVVGGTVGAFIALSGVDQAHPKLTAFVLTMMGILNPPPWMDYLWWAFIGILMIYVLVRVSQDKDGGKVAYRVGWWVLTAFMWVWGTIIAVVTFLDVAWTPWHGLFDPFFAVHYLLDMIVALIAALPAFGALWLREKLEQRKI